jgi:hypothetical protein
MRDDNASPVIQQRDEIVRGSAPIPVAAALLATPKLFEGGWAARCAFAIRASHSEAATVTLGRSQQSHRNRANLRLASRVLRAPGFRERNSIFARNFLHRARHDRKNRAARLDRCFSSSRLRSLPMRHLQNSLPGIFCVDARRM